jgi:hypothetical protein
MAYFHSMEDGDCNWGLVEQSREEEADNIFFADLWEQIEALEERVKVQSVHIQQVKLATDEMKMMKEAWEIMVICPCAKNFCS